MNENRRKGHRRVSGRKNSTKEDRNFFQKEKKIPWNNIGTLPRLGKGKFHLGQVHLNVEHAEQGGQVLRRVPGRLRNQTSHCPGRSSIVASDRERVTILKKVC